MCCYISVNPTTCFGGKSFSVIAIKTQGNYISNIFFIKVFNASMQFLSQILWNRMKTLFNVN